MAAIKASMCEKYNISQVKLRMLRFFRDITIEVWQYVARKILGWFFASHKKKVYNKIKLYLTKLPFKM